MGATDADAAPAGRSYWQALRYLGLSRLVVAALLIAYVPLFRAGIDFEEGVDSELFLAVAGGYFGTAIVFVLLARTRRLGFELLLRAQVVADLVALTLLVHAAGGVRSGLGVLLILPTAAAAILSGARLTLFFAATAALLLLLETGWRGLRGDATESHFLQAGLTGAAMLVTVVLVNRLARRLDTQERLAARRGEDLRRQLAITQVVISELPDGVVVLGERGEMRASNRSAREMLGPAEPGADPPGVAVLWAALGTGAHRADEPIEFVVPRRDAPGRRLRARRLGGPGAAGTVLMLEDLGRVEQRAQQLKLASMGRLSASIAHEIRNPLGAIRHANGLLAEHLHEPQLRRLATIVEDNSLRINRIVEDVLSISRRAGASPAALPAATALPQMLAEHLGQSGADRARVACRIDSPQPVWFDADNLRQVLANLLDNALRYASAANGAVTLEWAEPAPGRAMLRVSDDGPGVAPSIREHLFEPFFTTEPRGTGLGLHLARELCSANGASIRYEPPGDNPPSRSAFVVEPRPAPTGTTLARR